jgi:hypothetical protein
MLDEAHKARGESETKCLSLFLRVIVNRISNTNNSRPDSFPNKLSIISGSNPSVDKRRRRLIAIINTHSFGSAHMMTFKNYNNKRMKCMR